MRKTFAIALIALLVFTGGYFGFGFYVNHAARQQVETLLADLKARGLETNLGHVGYDFFGGLFEMKDLVITIPDMGTVKIAALTASGLEQGPSSRLSAREVTVSGISYDGILPLAPDMQTYYSVPRLDMSALELPADGTARSALAFFEQVAAERVSIPESTVTTRAGTDNSLIETTVTHGVITLEKLAGGRFATATVEPSRLTLGGTPENSGQGSIGRIEAEGVNIATILIVLDSEFRQNTNEFRSLYDSVRMDGYEITTHVGFSQSWGKMEVREVAILPAAIPMDALIEAGMRVQQLEAQGEETYPAEAAELLRTMAGIYSGLRIGAIHVEDIKTSEPGGTSSSLASLKAGPLDSGRLERLAMEKLAGTDASGNPFSLDSLVIRDLRLDTLLEVSASLAAESDEASFWPAPLFSVLGGIEIDSASAETEKGEPIRIDRLALSWNGEKDALPTRFSATLRLTGPTSAIDPGQSAFALVPDQMTRVSISADIAAQWDEPTGTATIAPFDIDISDALSFSARVKLSDVEDSVFSTQPDEALAGAMAINLGSIELHLTDAGLYEQKLTEAAKEQGLDPEAIRQLFAGFAELLFSQTVADRPELGPAVQSFVAFIQRPMSTLSLRITPRAGPLPMMMIVEALNSEDPLSLVDELDIDAIDTP